MKATKIKSTDVDSMKVSSLPSRPTAPTAMGGKGYTATEMKAAFDKLPLHLVSKFNDLLDDITDPYEGLSASLPTGIKDGHTLKDLLDDIKDGEFASYINVKNIKLSDYINALQQMDDDHEYRIVILEMLANDSFIECGKCTYRNANGGFN